MKKGNLRGIFCLLGEKSEGGKNFQKKNKISKSNPTTLKFCLIRKFRVVGFGIENGNIRSTQIHIQRVLALCDFWDLEKFVLGKNRISQIFILWMQ